MSNQPVATYDQVVQFLTQRGIKPTGNQRVDYMLAQGHQDQEQAAKNPEVAAIIARGGSGHVNNAFGDADVDIENGKVTNVTRGSQKAAIGLTAATAGAIFGGGAALGAFGGAGGAAAPAAASLGPVAAGGGTTAAAVPASLAATGGGSVAGGAGSWLAKNGLDLALGGASLLGGKPGVPDPYTGSTTNPEATLSDVIARTKALQAQVQAHQPLKLREVQGQTQDIAPVSIPGLGLQIGGALHRDYLPTSDPMQQATDQQGSGMMGALGDPAGQATPVRRKLPPIAGMKLGQNG